jgi:integrase
MMERTEKLLNQWTEMLSDTHPEAWLFASETGSTPISYANVYRRRIEPAFVKMGLKGINFQVLRRTWVTEFAEAEADQLFGPSLAVIASMFTRTNTGRRKKKF